MPKLPDVPVKELTMRKKNFVLLSLSLTVTSSSEAATLTVDLIGRADYSDIQSALDAAKDGDTVLVKPGEYVITETIDFNRFQNPDDLASPGVKNIVVNSERGADVTTIRISMEPVDPVKRNVVIFKNGEGNTTVLEGFGITGGNVVDSFGGGLLCINSSPSIRKCLIYGNRCEVDFCGSVKCLPLRGGGGLHCLRSSPQVFDCNFFDNSAGYVGGGVYCIESNPMFINCIFSNNLASVDGGGVYLNASSPTLINCMISGNIARSGGAGGILCGQMSSPILKNCTISGNRQLSYITSGNALACWGNSKPKILSSIMWNNTGDPIYTDDASSPSISYSCIQIDPVWTGEGNINRDPQFVKPGLWNNNGTPDDPFDDQWMPGDYHLQAGSPCIDAGHPDGTSAIDLEGYNRVCGKGVDIGAYEYGYCVAPAPVLLEPGDIVVLEQGDVTFNKKMASLIKINPITGEQSIISEGGFLSNAIGQNPNGFLYDKNRGRFLVVDRAQKLVSIDCATGSQQVLDSTLQSMDPTAIALESTGDLLITDFYGRLFRFDSGGGFLSVVAEGGLLGDVAPFSVQVGQNGQIFVSALTGGGWDVIGLPSRVIRIDPSTGAQSLVLESTTEMFRDFAIEGSIAFIAISARGGPSSSDRIAVLNLSTGALTSVVNGLERVVDVEIEASGNLLILDQDPPECSSPGECRGLVYRSTRTGELSTVSTKGFMGAPGRMLVIHAGDDVQGGGRLPGDANGDGALDLSDAVATLGILFLGSPKLLPCELGSATDPANIKLMDWQSDGMINIADGVAILSFLFLGGNPHALAPQVNAEGCIRIVGCSDFCGK
jgi:parallel beta-helix repeat protein